MALAPYAELHCHSHFSFLDGASAPDDLVARAVELGLTGLAITDHQGLYGAVRFSAAAAAAGLHPVIGIEIELLDAAAPDPGAIVVPARRAWKPGRRPPVVAEPPRIVGGVPVRPRPERARLPGHRAIRKEDHRGIGEAQRGPHLVLLARDATGWRSLCRMVSRANLAGTKAVPAFTQALLAEHAEGLLALSGCRHGELARRLLAGDREGARAVAERYAALFGSPRGFLLELQHHLLPDDDWLASETARLASELGLPVVVTNDVHYAHPEGRELQDVVTAIRHGRSLAELGDLRRSDGESHLKGAAELLALPPGEPGTVTDDPVLARAWREGIATTAEVAAACRVELAFERYRFPGFPIPRGQTPFSHLSELVLGGRPAPVPPAHARRRAAARPRARRHREDRPRRVLPDLLGPDAVRQVARDPGAGTGKCGGFHRRLRPGHHPRGPDPSRAAVRAVHQRGPDRVPGRGHRFQLRAAGGGDPVRVPAVRGRAHGNGRNLVTYRARSAVREVGYALGFPRPLVDRVAKALETYDSVMVRRDLEAEGGFAQFFARPDEVPDDAAVDAPATDAVRGSRRLVAEMSMAGVAAMTGERGLTDSMGQLNHERGGRLGAMPGTVPASPVSASPTPPVRDHGSSNPRWVANWGAGTSRDRATARIGRVRDARAGYDERGSSVAGARRWAGSHGHMGGRARIRARDPVRRARRRRRRPGRLAGPAWPGCGQATGRAMERSAGRRTARCSAGLIPGAASSSPRTGAWTSRAWTSRA